LYELQVTDTLKKSEENLKCTAFVKQLTHTANANEEVGEDYLLAL
jgi:hypothetical protein